MNRQKTIGAILSAALILCFASTTSASAGVPGSVRVQALNFRVAPWEEVIAVLSQNTPVDILAAAWARHPTDLSTSIWYKVSCELNNTQKTGWVHSFYITVYGTPPTPAPLPALPSSPPVPGYPPLQLSVAEPEKVLETCIPSNLPGSGGQNEATSESPKMIATSSSIIDKND